jgi:integrase
VHNAGVPTIRLHELRHTHGSLLIRHGIPVKVVSERLGHANIAFTIQTYQHLLPGMQDDAALAAERLPVAPFWFAPARFDSVDHRRNSRRKSA